MGSLEKTAYCTDCVVYYIYSSCVFIHTVGKSASYAEVVRGTHRNGSDVADVVCQPLVNGRM
jgi:hypothetical protein